MISSQSLDSISMDEISIWRNIRKELEEVGVSIQAFEANKEFIKDWLKEKITTSAFEEEMVDGDSSNAEDAAKSIEE